MDFKSAVQYLERHVSWGMKPGLERIGALLDHMARPDQGYPIVHVAGTNGKTSTSRMVTQLTVAHGLSTGTFTSPHLERIEERLAINGRTSTPDEFAQAVTDVAAFAGLLERDRGETLTYFELITAAAFAFFADQAVEAAVVEVGLGGRLDATNAVRGDVAVLTGIDFDHTEMLGESLEQIAGEKVAIVKPGAILITGELPPPAAAVAEGTVRELGVEHRRYGRDFDVAGTERAIGGWYCGIKGAEDLYEDIYLPVHGRHQMRNLAVAVAAAEALLGRGLEHQAVIDAAAAVSCPGRMEVIERHPLLLLDGAHNAQGFRVLAESLDEEFRAFRWVLVVAAMQDKDLEMMLPSLVGRIERVIATAIDSPRALAPDDLASKTAALLSVPAEAVPVAMAAVERAKEVAGPEGAVLVTGSLYLVGAVRSHLLRGEPAQPNER